MFSQCVAVPPRSGRLIMQLLSLEKIVIIVIVIIIIIVTVTIIIVTINIITTTILVIIAIVLLGLRLNRQHRNHLIRFWFKTFTYYVMSL